MSAFYELLENIMDIYENKYQSNNIITEDLIKLKEQILKAYETDNLFIQHNQDYILNTIKCKKFKIDDKDNLIVI